MSRIYKSVAVAVMLMLTLAVGLDVLPAAAQDNSMAERTITVSGAGQASGTPNVAYLVLGVDVTNSDPTEAFNAVNNGINAVRDAVMALSVAREDIQTTGFNMWAQDSYDPQTGAPNGERTYRAQNMLSITVRDIATTGEVITAAINAGANSINGLNFGIADTSALAQDARLKAIDDARSRAQQIAQALGVTLGEPVKVDETISGGPIASQVAYAAVGGGGGASVSEGQLTVNVQLTITFAIG